jgi:hypothetical protein
MMTPRADAHALSYSPVSGGAGIRATYDDGTPAAFCAVQVFAPGETQLFAEGMTDREGRFMFAAVTDGAWRVLVDDGMGHALDETIEIQNGLPLSIGHAAQPSRAAGVITGISLIFGIFGLWALFRVRMRRTVG